MARPRILLVPEFTELQWAIKPMLEEWAEVASYDPPGIGKEPRPEAPTPELVQERFRGLIVERGLEEAYRRGWDRFLVAADSWAMAPAARLVRRRPESVSGMALGHASLSHRRSGERPVVNPEVHSALTQLVSQDSKAFLRYGIPQATRGSIDEDLAARMVERIPLDLLQDGWQAMTADEPFGEILLELDCPMLLAKHDGCLMHTDEGFEDAVTALPDAKTVVLSNAPSVDPGFAEAIRGFSEGLDWG